MENTEQRTLNSNYALASLILGIISIITTILTIPGFTLGIIGLIFGIFGLREIKHERQTGRKMAIAGVVCNIIGIVLPLLIPFIAMNFG
ncbi:DUF4190 domain-containing protein [Anaerobacillus sp. MEB173]|uniref:DUF4190 domain-containing protein n=1 Tax=Anaerobacillus sp. MEB173 TaxID=3383345 RepID=UPI003F913E26